MAILTGSGEYFPNEESLYRVYPHANPKFEYIDYGNGLTVCKKKTNNIVKINTNGSRRIIKNN